MRNDIGSRLGAAILSPALMSSAGILNFGAKPLNIVLRCVPSIPSSMLHGLYVHGMCVVHTMFDCLVCCVGAKPSLLNIVRLVVPTIVTEWKEVGQALGVEREALATVRRSEHRADGRALELLALWSQSAAGTGSQPRTWHSLLAAIETVIGRRERDKIEAKLNTLSPSPVFDKNCQEIVSVYKPQVINYVKNACQL